jgi:hypothetical protein
MCPEVHGKKVDWISHWYEEGLCFFSVRFTDGKNFCVACHPVIVTDTVDFSDMKTGDDVIIREYYKRRDEDCCDAGFTCQMVSLASLGPRHQE